MPNMSRDDHSGAIIFHLTEEEKALKELKEELEHMKGELQELLKAAKKGERK